MEPTGKGTRDIVEWYLVGADLGGLGEEEAENR